MTRFRICDTTLIGSDARFRRGSWRQFGGRDTSYLAPTGTWYERTHVVPGCDMTTTGVLSLGLGGRWTTSGR